MEGRNPSHESDGVGSAAFRSINDAALLADLPTPSSPSHLSFPGLREASLIAAALPLLLFRTVRLWFAPAFPLQTTSPAPPGPSQREERPFKGNVWSPRRAEDWLSEEEPSNGLQEPNEGEEAQMSSSLSPSIFTVAAPLW